MSRAYTAPSAPVPPPDRIAAYLPLSYKKTMIDDFGASFGAGTGPVLGGLSHVFLNEINGGADWGRFSICIVLWGKGNEIFSCMHVLAVNPPYAVKPLQSLALTRPVPAPILPLTGPGYLPLYLPIFTMIIDYCLDLIW